MKRLAHLPEWLYWLPLAFWVPVGVCAALALSPRLDDLDMPEILSAIDARGGLSSCPGWFVDDWPLANRLYRPVTACAFAFERALFGDAAIGYRLLSAAILLLTAVLIVLLLRAVGAGKPAATLAGVLFLITVWRIPLHPPLSLFWFVATVALLILAWRARRERRRAPGSRWSALYVALSTGVYFGHFDRVTLHLPTSWIAAQTVLWCTLFAVAALLCLWRYQQSGRRLPAYLTLLFTALALGAYEQGILVPPLVTALALANRRRSRSPVWPLVAACWVLAVGYWVIRREVLGPTPGAYEAVVIQPNLTRFWFWLHYTCRVLSSPGPWDKIHWSAWTVFDPTLWRMLAQFLSVGGAGLALCRSWRIAWPFFFWKVFTYLPMSFLRPMDHYLLLSEAGSCALAGILLAAAFTAAWRLRKAPAEGASREAVSLPDPVGE